MYLYIFIYVSATHANVKPPALPSWIAFNNFSLISFSDVYIGKSNWLKQVCDWGNGVAEMKNQEKSKKTKKKPKQKKTRQPSVPVPQSTVNRTHQTTTNQNPPAFPLDVPVAPVFTLIKWIWNFCGPFIPCNVLKPPTGTFEVPVTYCTNNAKSCWSIVLKMFQNHMMFCDDFV